MAKFFLLLGENNGNKRRNFSSFTFSSLDKKEFSPIFSALSQILSGVFPILSDVFKIPREEK